MRARIMINFHLILSSSDEIEMPCVASHCLLALKAAIRQPGLIDSTPGKLRYP